MFFLARGLSHRHTFIFSLSLDTWEKTNNNYDSDYSGAMFDHCTKELMVTGGG